LNHGAVHPGKLQQKTNHQAHMNQQPPQRHYDYLGLLALALFVALPVSGQQRGGGTGAAAGGRSTSGTTGREYPSTGAIGDAYYSIDPETRRVVTIADEDTSRYISQVLSNLDRPKPQVLIKVVFLEVTHNNASDIGIEGGWTGTGNSPIANAANVFGMSFLNSATTNGMLQPNGTSVNAVGQPVSSFQSTASSVAGGNAGLYQVLGQNYQATLRAIAQSGNAKVLSRPSILARNNQPATIAVGQLVPLITSVSYNPLNGTPVNAITYQNVGVILTVTPFITSDGLVEMIVAPQVSSIDSTTSVPIAQGVNAPVIDNRSANTVAVTPDGQTVVLGGLMQNSKAKSDTKIPVLGDIPVLGALFKRTVKNDSQTELMIFLTPHIVQAPSQLVALSASETQKSDGPKNFGEEELNKFIDALPGGAPKRGKDSPFSPVPGK
jgi:general secretion pathway protein D